MKTKYDKEDLFHSLPDYISGNIESESLKTEIEKEIETNPDFKNEYEEIKRTFYFLDSAELESPDERYFNNLSVRINDRVNSESYGTFWERAGWFWKILLPAIPVIIAITILYNIYKNDAPEIKLTDMSTDKNKNELVKDKDNPIDNKTPVAKKDNEITIDKENPDISDVLKTKQNDVKQNRIRRSVTKIFDPATVGNNLQNVKGNFDKKLFPDLNMISDNMHITGNSSTETEEDILYINDNEDDNYEDEFLNLSPEEQREVLENLNKSKI